MFLDLGHFKVLGGLVFFVQPLYFNYALCFKNWFLHFFVTKFLIPPFFVCPESFTQNSALRKVFNFYTSGFTLGNTSNTLGNTSNTNYIPIKGNITMSMDAYYEK